MEYIRARQFAPQPLFCIVVKRTKTNRTGQQMCYDHSKVLLNKVTFKLFSTPTRIRRSNVWGLKETGETGARYFRSEAPRGGLKYKIQFLGFPGCPCGDFKSVTQCLKERGIFMTSASKYSIWNYSREGGLVQQNWGGIQSTVSELNGTPLKRALFCTGWASIVNTSFSCLTRFPSNRKTEMRPCKKKKKKRVLKGSRQYLIHPVQPEDLQK